MSEIKGYVILWKMADISARYEDLAGLAADVNFAQGQDEAKKFIPQPPRKRNAWEKATNLGKTGLKVEAPAALVERVKKQYNCDPVVRLRTAIISKSAPLLVRHIVREVVIPVKDKSAGYKTLAEKQLNSQTVSVMEFDTLNDTMTTSSYHELHDESGWVNGNLKAVVQELHQAVDKALNYADGDDVRDGVRTWLFAHDAALMSTSGGAYFVPNGEGVADLLVGLKAYVEGLNEYRVNKAGDELQVTVFPWIKTDSGDVFSTGLDIARNIVSQFKADLQDVVTELQPVVSGERSAKVAENARNRATVKFLETSARIEKYKGVLEDELQELTWFLEMAQQTMLAAQSAPVKAGKEE